MVAINFAKLNLIPAQEMEADPYDRAFQIEMEEAAEMAAQMWNRIAEVEEMERQLYPRLRSEKGPLRRNGDKARFGGEKSWQQHRGDGDESGIVQRRAAQKRYFRCLMQDDAELGIDAELDIDPTPNNASLDEESSGYLWDLAAVETAPHVGAFDTSSGERHLTVDVGDFLVDAHVFLRYGANGKLASAHCRMHRR